MLSTGQSTTSSSDFRTGELASADALLSGMHCQLALLNNEVNLAKRRLALLLQERSVIQANVAGSSTSHPIHRMPVELLEEIFIHYLSTKPAEKGTSLAIPMTLTRVCSQWRTIAFNTPRLWSCISISAPSAQHSFNASQITHVLSHWITHSGQCGLSITLECPRLEKGALKAVQHLLFPTSRRWFSLDLHVPDALLQSLLALPPTSFPSLESFTLRNASLLDRRTGVRPSRAGIWESPRLREVALLDVELDHTMLASLPLGSLRRLVLVPELTMRAEALGVSDVLWLLSRATQLQSCTIALEDDAMEGACHHRSICMTYLRELEIQLKTSGVPVDRLLGAVHAAALQRVRLIGYASERLHMNSLNQMLERSSKVAMSRARSVQVNGLWDIEVTDDP